MKKKGILNSDISAILSDMGHTDKIVIADCGLPIPEDIMKIDISLSLGNPKFIDVLYEVLKDMKVEKVILASEIKDKNKILYEEILSVLETDNVGSIDYVSHEEFKAMLKDVRAVIRTGEATPYANIILQSGVIF